MLRQRLLGACLIFTAVGLATAQDAQAQRVLTDPQEVITVARGKSALIIEPTSSLDRVSVADPEIVDAVAVSPRELLINGLAIGTTSLIIWTESGAATWYTVEVTADAEGLERQLDLLFPTVGIDVISTGNTVILSGEIRNPSIARRALAIAEETGASVINNLQAPAPEQILLQVRFAEVSRNASRSFGTALSGRNIDELELDGGTDWEVETLSDGLVQLFLSGDNTAFNAVIDALKARGEFRSLAEPNLLAIEGQEAEFLAGGEFPYPVVQGNTGAVSIQWQEFGVKLNFLPRITNTGSIRLTVAPEVSQLDFANGLTLSGFRVPSILTRRASTEVELEEGQHLAIAGLMDNTLTDNVDKIPFLGDLPIIGALFRREAQQQDQTELLVIVTPHIVQPTDSPPAIPPGEPETWDWLRGLRPQDLPAPAGSPNRR